jgi:hypothetical protein
MVATPHSFAWKLSPFHPANVVRTGDDDALAHPENNVRNVAASPSPR